LTNTNNFFTILLSFFRKVGDINGKEKEEKEEEIVGKLFGALPIDQLVSLTTQVVRDFL